MTCTTGGGHIEYFVCHGYVLHVDGLVDYYNAEMVGF